jgi:hypothetical protein
MKITDIQNVLPVGPRALGIYTDTSDYDFVVMKDELPKELYNILTNSNCLMAKYFNVVANHPTYVLKHLKFDDLDAPVNLIVLESALDLGVFVYAIHELEQLPKHFLQRKQLRINLWEASLIRSGFKRVVYDFDEELLG